MHEPSRIAIIESDVATTKAMVTNYEAEVNRLRSDGTVLNDELKNVLKEYQSLTGELKVGGDASFVKEARGIVGPTISHLTAAALGMGLLYALSRTTRRRRAIRADRRGADGLFFNFG